MHLTHGTSPRIPHLPERTRLAVWRDLVLIALSLALMVGFLARVWRLRPPAELRTHASVGADVRS